MKKFRFSLAPKVALIVLAGAVILSVYTVDYSAKNFGALISQKFAEKVVTLGENCVYMMDPYIRHMADKKMKQLPEKDLKAIKYLLEAAVTREDMLYVALLMDGKVIAVSSADGRDNFAMPQVKKTQKDMLGYFIADIEGMTEHAVQLSFPIDYKNKDVAEVLVGFDMTVLNHTVEKTKTTALITGLFGALLMSAALFVYFFFGIVGPVSRMSDMAEKISRGEVGENIKIINTGDEIGELSKSFNDMTAYISEISAMAQGISEGLLTEGFKPRSEKDVLGKSFQRMLSYINEIAVVLTEIAKGRLTRTHNAKSEKDVLGIASASMLISLKSLVSRIKEHAVIIANSSVQLQQISEQSQSTISQLAETIANISQATSESAKNSQAAATASMNAEEAAKQGGRKMTALLEKMTVLSDEINSSTQRMQKLAVHSEEIKKMTIVIKGIADETKLLSFNAAIEAARAGESGRGFVIVAEEIRKLSDLSTEQAIKIGNQIKEVRADIASAIEMVQKETQSISESADLTKETSSLFADIEKAVDETAEQVSSIAASAEEIAASSEESASASQEQAAAMEELNASVSELANVSKTLRNETENFEV